MLARLASVARRYATDSTRVVLQHFWTLVIYGCAFGVLGVAVTTPALAWVVGRLLATSGRTAVSNFDLVGLGLSAQGVAIIGVLGASFFALRFLHEALVLATLFGDGRGASGRVGAIVAVARAMPRILPLGALEFGVLLGAAAPFLLLVLVAYLLLPGEHDINYYLSTMPPSFRAVLIGAGVVIAIGAIVVGVVFGLLAYATPYVLFEGDRPIRAVKRSVRTAWSSRARTLGALMGQALAVLAIIGVALALAMLLQAAVLGAAGQSVDAVVVGISLLLFVNAAGAVAIAFASFTTRTAIVGMLYRQAGGRPPIVPGQGSTLVTRVRRVVLAGVVAVVAGTTGTAWWVVGQIKPRTTAMITAHRGASLLAPENTIAAFEAAIEAGADMIELDVQETRDGEVVVLHDSDLMRVAGDPRKIWELSLDEVRAIDVGRSFRAAFEGEHVPTLREAIETVRGRARLLIELKYNGHDEDLAARVVGILREEDFLDDVMIMSLDERGLAEVRALEPGIPTGWTIARSLGDVTRVDVDFLSLGSEEMSGRLFRRARATGKSVHVWTANEREDVLRYLYLGVDNIITDDVEQAVRLRNERASMSIVERILLSFRYRMPS